ncbi:RNA-directed DNA polymerase [Roseomonas sp. CCTCC AB2023176]|uniref:RNA-directed DNA polymerase n=1 Tax=Roseomonas sp. CCTCC AB2023176 TaxID=3342640 RepID=UPI0035DAD6FF
MTLLCKPNARRDRHIAALASQVMDAPTAMAAGAPYGRLLAVAREEVAAAETYARRHAGTRRARHLIASAHRTFLLRLVKADEAARRHRSRQKQRGETLHGPAHPAAVVRLAWNLRPEEASREPATLLILPKGAAETVTDDGRWRSLTAETSRPVVRYGFEHRTRQRIVAWCAGLQHQIHPAQFATKGRGLAEMWRHIAGALDSGFRHFAIFDIADCFGSFDAEAALPLLRLPRRLIAHSATGLSARFNHDRKGGPSEARGQGQDVFPEEEQVFISLQRSMMDRTTRGLPQGSAASGILANILLAPVFDAVPDDVRVFAYCDDILILAQDQKALTRGVTALEASLTAGRLPGAFQTRNKGKGFLPLRGRPDRFFEFCGARFDMQRGKVQVGPSARALTRADDRLSKLCRLTACYEAADDRLIATLRAFLVRFPAWRGRSAFAKQVAEEWDGARWERSMIPASGFLACPEEERWACRVLRLTDVRQLSPAHPP